MQVDYEWTELTDKLVSQHKGPKPVISNSAYVNSLSVGSSWAFMESHLPVFKEKNPQLDVVTELSRGHHPYLKGIYRNHNERVVCVKNLEPKDIMQQATRLRNSLGRKVIKLRTKHVTKHPSVQGTWTTATKF